MDCCVLVHDRFAHDDQGRRCCSLLGLGDLVDAFVVADVFHHKAAYGGEKLVKEYNSVEEFLKSQIFARPVTFKEIEMSVNKARQNCHKEMSRLKSHGFVETELIRVGRKEWPMYRMKQLRTGLDEREELSLRPSKDLNRVSLRPPGK